MIVVWLPLTVFYAVGGLACARMLAGHWAWALHSTLVRRRSYCPASAAPTRPNGEHWVGATTGALLLSVIWPLVLFWIAWPIKVGHERRGEEQVTRRNLAKHIAILEREAGIKD